MRRFPGFAFRAGAAPFCALAGLGVLREGLAARAGFLEGFALEVRFALAAALVNAPGLADGADRRGGALFARDAGEGEPDLAERAGLGRVADAFTALFDTGFFAERPVLAAATCFALGLVRFAGTGREAVTAGSGGSCEKGPCSGTEGVALACMGTLPVLHQIAKASESGNMAA